MCESLGRVVEKNDNAVTCSFKQGSSDGFSRQDSCVWDSGAHESLSFGDHTARNREYHMYQMPVQRRALCVTLQTYSLC